MLLQRRAEMVDDDFGMGFLRFVCWWHKFRMVIMMMVIVEVVLVGSAVVDYYCAPSNVR